MTKFRKRPVIIEAVQVTDATFDGHGYEPPEPEDEWPKCPTCKGRGLVNPLTAPEGFFCVGTTDCPTCDGSGDAKLGKEQKALDAGVLREALETACECPRCGRAHRPLGFGRPPLNDADKQIAFLESAVKEALKSHAEIGEPPIATDRWIRLVTERDQIKEALVQLSRAVIALAEFDNDKRTYFETNTAEAVIRWRRLNAAQAVARNLIGGHISTVMDAAGAISTTTTMREPGN